MESLKVELINKNIFSGEATEFKKSVNALLDRNPYLIDFTKDFINKCLEELQAIATKLPSHYIKILRETNLSKKKLNSEIAKYKQDYLVKESGFF